MMSSLTLILGASFLSRAAALGFRNATFAASVGSRNSSQQALGNVVGHKVQHSLSMTQPACQCVANNPAWVPTTRTVPKCIFIDLGAADGNTLKTFLSNGYGPVANCPSGGQWEAYLVEANPQFKTALDTEATTHPGMVHAMGSTAAYVCEGTTSFYIDTNAANNHWGSSMSKDHPDAIASGQQQVTVPTVNVVQLIAQTVIPGDWVMLKVDIEGAEYDLVPCLAQYTNVNLVDRMFLEEHTWFKTESATTPEQFQAAKQTLISKGVDIPEYFTQTM